MLGTGGSDMGEERSMPQFDRDFVDRNGERYMLPARIEKACRWLREEYLPVADGGMKLTLLLNLTML